MKSIVITLAVEDILSEAVLRQILHQSQRSFVVTSCLSRGGNGYIKKIINGLNHSAKGSPYLVLTDLDDFPCPSALISKWLSTPKHPNLIFRIAIREIESWLLADRKAFSNFLGVSKEDIPTNVDQILNPKKYLIELAKKSKNRTLRNAIAPESHTTARVGKNYNGQLIEFVEQYWKLSSAQESSPSLKRAVRAIVQFQPV